MNEAPDILTVIIRDVAPLMHLNEPCLHRTVQIALTAEQREALRFRHNYEEVSSCHLEPPEKEGA